MNPFTTSHLIESGCPTLSDFLSSHNKVVNLSLVGLENDHLYNIDRELSLKCLKYERNWFFNNDLLKLYIQYCKETLIEFHGEVFDLEVLQALMNDCPNLKIMNIKLYDKEIHEYVELKSNSSIEILTIDRENKRLLTANAFDIVQKFQNLKKLIIKDYQYLIGFYLLRTINEIRLYPNRDQANFYYKSSNLIEIIRTQPNLKHVEIPKMKGTKDELKFLKENLITFKSEFSVLE
jgi:hypothetical protein